MWLYSWILGSFIFILALILTVCCCNYVLEMNKKLENYMRTISQ